MEDIRLNCLSLIGVKRRLEKMDTNYPTAKKHKFVMYADGSCGILNGRDEDIGIDDIVRN